MFSLPLRSIAIGLALVVMSATPAGALSDPTGGCNRSDHEAGLADGETRAIAAELLDIPTYCYVDVPASEVDATLQRLDALEQKSGGDVFSAVALHSVVSDVPAQNTARGSTGPEVGFLQLFTFVDVPPAGIEKRLATASMGRSRPKTLDFAGQTVYLFTDRNSRDTRYTYTWLRHGVQGAFDGATRPAMERWLLRYFAQPDQAPGENTTISRWLVPVPGYLAADYSDPGIVDEFVTAPLGDVPASLHRIADGDGAIGGLVLAQAPDGTTAETYAAGFSGFGPSQTVTVGGVPMVRFEDGGAVLYVWVVEGIAGGFLSSNATKAEAFVAALLAAPR